MSECDVFISYKREERARAEFLAQKLKSVGLNVWFDTKLAAGASFDDEIAAHLKSAKAVLVCWTPGAIGSDWVRAEAAMGRQSNKLVAVFLAPTDLIPPFNLVHTEDLSSWTGEDDHAAWVKVLTRIASLSDKPALQEWSALMAAGDAASMRKWIEAQPPGPLRNASRYWLSEMGAAPVMAANPTGIRPKSRAARSGGLVPVLLGLLLIVLVGAGGFYFWRVQSEQNGAALEAEDARQSVSPDDNGEVAIVTPEAPQAIAIENGAIVRIPINYLVDFETGRVTDGDGPNYDFEIVYNTHPRIRARGAARVNYGAQMATAPNERQCAEVERNNGLWSDVYVSETQVYPYQCFRTVEGHLGFFRVISNPDTPDGPVELAVTFFSPSP